MLHYNFPAFSVGETGRYGAPGRREIGHGALGERALLQVMPSEEEFPYTVTCCIMKSLKVTAHQVKLQYVQDAYH